MQNINEKFYVTTAIPYASQKPHVGNTYDIVLADAIARYKRARGFDVHFVTGSDEHGQKVEKNAAAAGITPKEYVDGIVKQIRGIWDLMDTTYDTFIRTTDASHKNAIQKIFNRFYEQGDIYKGEYEGLYCVPCESFFTPSQVDSKKCPDCGRDILPAKEEAYFFRLSKYSDKLLAHIEANPDFIKPKSREHEMINNFLKPGLQDLCVSRTSFTWGVPVESDPKHIMYVWMDALCNYITAIGYNPEEESGLFNKYWPCDLHIVGKDVVRFHVLYWPCFLMALGLELPKQVLAHPWYLFGENKMSKTTGNVIYAETLCDIFSVDATRYYMLSEMPYAHDGSITYQNVLNKYNSDLANTLGNLVSRSVSMTRKYFGGKIRKNEYRADIDNELIAAANESAKQYTSKMDEYKLAEAIDAIMSLARRANKYVDETEPWILGRDEKNKPRLETVLYNLLESIRIIGIMAYPIMPKTAESIFSQIGTSLTGYDSIFSFGEIGEMNVGDPKPLFARLDEKTVMSEIETLLSKTDENAAAEVKENISKDIAPKGITIGIEDFAKVELKAAEIIECSKVEKSDKLLKLKLDDGNSVRQVVSGIAKWYAPDSLPGKKVILVANLKPAKLRGVESNGMILAADAGEDNVKVMFIDNDIPNGSKIR